MNGIKLNASPSKWSGIEHVPRTLASCWHLLSKRLAELEMYGYDGSECSSIREAIETAVNAALAPEPREKPRLVTIRWQGSPSGFDLSIDGRSVVSGPRTGCCV